MCLKYTYYTMRGKKRTKETFIRDSRKIHNNKYDYSKVNFINTMIKVKIICPIHGEFTQMPCEHLKGRGCPQCSKDSKRKTIAQFIEDAKKVHGEKYDYSKVKYIDNKTKVCIICPIHGEFWQAPIKHLMAAQGCPKCNKIGKKIKEVNNISFTNTTNYAEKFIKEAPIKHKNKYDYSKVNYVNTNTKVCIICPKHGEFWQTPHHHLDGRGCPKCGRKIVTTETYLELINERYDDKYNFSKIVYKNRKTPITVICKEHGEFNISPITLLNNQDAEHCPICQTKKNILETKLFETIQQKFNNQKIVRNYHNHKILGRKEIDIYFPKLKIGIEYQGGQHFKPIDLFGGKEVFKKQLERDYEKIEQCKQNEIMLLHFTYESNIKTDVSYKIYNDINDIINIIETKIKMGS